MKMKPHLTFVCLLLALILVVAAACESIECPITNVVYATYAFYTIEDGEATAVTVLDTITVTAAGTDSVLVNKYYSQTEVELPMSYTADADTLVFEFTDSLSHTSYDTIWVTKENTQHYESPDCPAAMFHYVTGVSCTHHLIDSVVIVKPDIDYNVTENFQIYFRNSN